MSFLAAMLWLTGAASATDAVNEVTVAPGQTLTQIASQHLGQLPLESAVAELVMANDLSGPQIDAGQTLVIPAQR